MKFDDPVDVILGNVDCLCRSGQFDGGSDSSVGIGIDPGRNFGIAVVHQGQVDVYYGRMPPGRYEDYGFVAFKMLENLELEQSYKAVVEGPAFEMQYGQAGLAYIREGYYIALRNKGLDVKIVPPMTIRKAVFGKGTVRPGKRKDQQPEIWPDLDPNAADSLACALCAIGKQVTI